jgi:hypothetical protein
MKWGSTTTDETIPHSSTSPLSLALSAILALIPLSQQACRFSAESTAVRRSVAQKFAQAALEHIEADSEFLDFTTTQYPGTMTLNQVLRLSRAPFHPETPVDLESILALLILSNYEHAQRGNLLKMTQRAGQALITAKNMSLHCQSSESTRFSEARRRAWWMTVSAP